MGDATEISYIRKQKTLRASFPAPLDPVLIALCFSCFLRNHHIKAKKLNHNMAVNKISLSNLMKFNTNPLLEPHHRPYLSRPSMTHRLLKLQSLRIENRVLGGLEKIWGNASRMRVHRCSSQVRVQGPRIRIGLMGRTDVAQTDHCTSKHKRLL